jgi:predicted Rossmann-fold nucleotide-binding protein
LINTNNYFEPLIDLIDHSIAHGFTKPATKDLITIVDTPEDAIKVFIDEILEAEISEAGPGAV